MNWRCRFVAAKLAARNALRIGLGLSILRRLVDSMGGRVVASEVGKDSTFGAWLPVEGRVSGRS